MNDGNSFDAISLAQRVLDELNPSRLSPVRRGGYNREHTEKLLQDTSRDVEMLISAIEDLSGRVTQLEAVPEGELEARRVSALLGDEAMGVLEAARVGAQQRMDRAAQQEEAILADARAEAAEMIAEARSEATEMLEAARSEGRGIVDEARDVRERLLSDLARKRRALRAELEYLRTFRERMLEALSSCQSDVDALVADLVDAVPSISAAAERAGLKVASEQVPTAQQLEAEISSARLAGISFGPEAQEDDAVQFADSGTEDDTASGPVDDTAASTHSEGLRAVAPPSWPGVPPRHPEQIAQDEPTVRVVEPAVLTNPDAERITENEPPVRVVEPAKLTEHAAEPSEVLESEAEMSEDVQVEPEPVVGTDPEVIESEVDEEEAETPETIESEEQESGVTAESIFARLRSETEGSAPDPGPQAESRRRAGPGGLAGTGVDVVDPAPAVEHESPSSVEDAHAAARAAAVGEITRMLKRAIMDEQGELLDRIRRKGAEALQDPPQAEPEQITSALAEPLENLASDAGVNLAEFDLEAAASCVHATLLEPVTDRLALLLADGDDGADLSTKVRAVYRESRTHRAALAAEAAVAAAWKPA